MSVYLSFAGSSLVGARIQGLPGRSRSALQLKQHVRRPSVVATLTGPIRRRNTGPKKQPSNKQRAQKSEQQTILKPLVEGLGDSIPALSQTLGLRRVSEARRKNGNARKTAKRGKGAGKAGRGRKGGASTGAVLQGESGVEVVEIKKGSKSEPDDEPAVTMTESSALAERDAQKGTVASPVSGSAPRRETRDLKKELDEHIRLVKVVEKHRAVRKRMVAMRSQARRLTTTLKRAGATNDDERLSPLQALKAELLKVRESSTMNQEPTLAAKDTGHVMSRSCSSCHPGNLCCTSTKIEVKGTGKLTLTMETELQMDEGISPSAYSEEDRIAIAAHTMAAEAIGLVKQRVSDFSNDFHARRPEHTRIVEILAEGELEMKKHELSQYSHESFLVKVSRKPVTGGRTQVCQAIFKPKVEGNGDGWHRANVEWVAYELGLMLGMDYIPPVVMRKNVRLLDREYDGALIYFVPNAQELRQVDTKKWGVSKERLLSDTRVLDVLLQNSDRHHGHFLYGEHWHSQEGRPILIDHAAGFRKEAFVHLEHDNAFQTGGTKRISSSTYLRLRFLDKKLVAEKFAGVLTNGEISALMTRKYEVLSYFDQLVTDKGYENAVIE